MTVKEQSLYNLYLATSKSSRNKPFKLRKNFKGFEDKPEYGYIKKIQSFLAQFPQIKPDIFFKAPFEIYKDQEYFDLQFFTTRKAIKTYTLYMKQRLEESPDAEDQLEFIKESLRYIALFCMKNNISVGGYLTHKTGVTYDWMKHVKDHNVSIYALFDLPDLFNIVGTTPEDEKELFLGNAANRLHIYKLKYMKSHQAINLVRKGLKKIIPMVDSQNKMKKSGDKG